MQNLEEETNTVKTDFIGNLLIDLFPLQLWVQKLGNGDGYILTKRYSDCLIYHTDMRVPVKCQFLEV